MPQKIFISYRRDDSAHSALSIGQYLEHEFGRKNVFIDVDMRAGAKFPEVLEARLAECKVMLVLIGPGWLGASDRQGRPRLHDSDDWVRLEIAQALKRNITVIPIRINGAELPERSELPEDIRSLLDHQATSVTHASFRHDMSGLVRDIRSIPSRRSWRKPSLIAAGIVVLAGIVFVFAQTLMHRVPERPRLQTSPEPVFNNGIWTGKPGEWILFASNSQKPAMAYYFHRLSLKKVADGLVVYTARFPVAAPRTTDSNLPTPAYEDEITVINCTESRSATTDRIVYTKDGAVLSRFNLGDPKTLISTGAPIKPGQIIFVAMRLACQNFHEPTLTKDMFAKLAYLTRTPNGDGNIYYAPPEKTAAPTHQAELATLLVYDSDRSFAADLTGGVETVGAPASYRSFGQRLKANCSERRLSSPKADYFDSSGNWLYVTIPSFEEMIKPTPNSPYAQLLTIACGANTNVSGAYTGTNLTTYKDGPKGQQKITLIVVQTGDQVHVTFRTALGDHGSGVGKLSGTRIDNLPLKSDPSLQCAGSYEAQIEFVGNDVKWSFEGKDCNGVMEGQGSATKTDT